MRFGDAVGAMMRLDETDALGLARAPQIIVEVGAAAHLTPHVRSALAALASGASNGGGLTLVSKAVAARARVARAVPALGGPKRAATPGGELAAFGAALGALHCAGAAIEWREHLGLVAPTVADRRSIVSPAPRRVRLPPTALLGEWHWFDARALEAAKIADAAERARTERAAAATKGRAFEVRWIEAPDTADSSVVAAASPALALVLVAAADADARAGGALGDALGGALVDVRAATSSRVVVLPATDDDAGATTAAAVQAALATEGAWSLVMLVAWGGGAASVAAPDSPPPHAATQARALSALLTLSREAQRAPARVGGRN